VATWQQAGYKPSLLLQAWGRLTSAFAQSFPDKLFSMALIPENPFPAIGEDGRPVKATLSDLNQSMVQAAAQRFPGHLVVQHNFLITGTPADPSVLSYAATYGTLFAFQTNNYLGSTQNGAACGGEVPDALPCDAKSYLQLLSTGISPLGKANGAHAAYIEVFPANAIALPADIQQAHCELTAC
jgi:hypothetical protein